MPKPRELAQKAPKWPCEQRRCRYCKCMFKTKPTWQGSQMKFCCAQHRKAFDYEGETPIGNILRRQEKHMRQIAQEEAEAAIERHYHYANGEQTGEGLLGMPEQ